MKALVIGSGKIGAAVAGRLIADPVFNHVTTSDINLESAERAGHEGAAMAAYRGEPAVTRAARVDLRSIESIADVIESANPDVIVQTGTLQDRGALLGLDADQRRLFATKARFGSLLPIHLHPVMNVMRAYQQTGLACPLINVALPDIVNPVVARSIQPPTTGAGNSDLIHPAIRVILAGRYGVPLSEVEVRLLAHHAHIDIFWKKLEDEISFDPATFWMKALVAGKDVTPQLDTVDLLREVGRLLPTEPTVTLRTASSAAKNAALLVGEEMTFAHSSSPLGAIGGHDVLIGQGRVEIVWPDELGQSAAIAVNERAQRMDGVDRIDADGSVHFTESAADAMRTLFGYDCPVLRPTDVADRADELLARINAALSGSGRMPESARKLV